MTHAHPRIHARWWAVVIAAALLAAVAALLPVNAQAAITKPTSTFYQINGTAPVSGLKLTGYGSDKTVYVAVKVTGQATVSVPTKAQTGLALPFGYASWSGSEIAFTGPVANANAALAALTITAGNVPFVKNSTANDVSLSFTAFDNSTGAAYNPANQHFYRYIPGKVTGTDALAAAAASSALGQTGYLASITSEDENAFVAQKIQGDAGVVAKNVWIGATDSAEEGKWVWNGGPDNGVQFWQGCDAASGGVSVEGRYSAWAPGEPNNWNASRCQVENSPTLGEDCAIINKYSPTSLPPDNAFFQGLWNDLPCSYGAGASHIIAGYVIEYGNKSVGGDYSGVDTLTSTFKARPYAPKVKANFFSNVFKLLFTSKKRKNLPKKPNKPATFTFKTKVKLVNPGTYIITIKRKDGKGVPYVLLSGTKAQAAGAKAVTLQSSRWSIEVRTTKANQTVTLDPVLKTMDWVKPSGTKLSVQLKTDSNMRCPLGWCESTPIPSPRDQGKVK
jgi:hypothetical protein